MALAMALTRVIFNLPNMSLITLALRNEEEPKAKRVASRAKVPLASSPQLQYVSTARGTHLQPRYMMNKVYTGTCTCVQACVNDKSIKQYSMFSWVLCLLLTELAFYQHPPHAHATSWLTVIPSERQGLHLNPPVFQTALKWWLGLDTAEGSHCALCPDKMLDPLGHHAATCKRGGDGVFRHNKLRDILAETCRRAHFSVQVLSSDHSHSRPVDVLISNWVLGKTAACDLSVTSR